MNFGASNCSSTELEELLEWENGASYRFDLAARSARYPSKASLLFAKSLTSILKKPLVISNS
jgi:hypothetical protein